MKILRSFFDKHRVLSFVIGCALSLATGAAAAFTIYDLTLSGTTSPNGITISTTHVGALTFSSNGVAPALDANSTVNVPVKVANADPGVAHTIATSGNTITLTASDTVDNCVGHLTKGAPSAAIGAGAVIPAGGQSTGTIPVTSDASLPLACSGSTYTISYSGTASS